MTEDLQPGRELATLDLVPLAAETNGNLPVLRDVSASLPAVPAGKSSAGLAATTPDDRDSCSVTALGDLADRSLHAAVARFDGAVAGGAGQAYLDWATHLAVSPGKRAQLLDKATRKAIRFGNYAYRYATQGADTPICIEPLPQDHRFAARGVAAMAVQFHGAGLSAAAAMVAQRHDRRARRFAAA